MIIEQFKSVKAKFQIDKFKSSKQIFCKFEGQFDLEGQGQGHRFLDIYICKRYFMSFRL